MDSAFELASSNLPTYFYDQITSIELLTSHKIITDNLNNNVFKLEVWKVDSLFI